ncbi:MAG: septum formation protein Maf [Burkholderiaceae bacterium]|nr:septum formation protein Maf [Burkholderiaceae bacterium]
MTSDHLILASTSSYRRSLLNRLQLPFTVVAPEVDEAPLAAEPPATLAQRLARLKALAVAETERSAIVIGSDQVATIDGQEPIGKPGTRDAAVAQLRAAAGRSLVFHTAVAVLRLRDGFERVALVDTTVRFRALADDEILAYVDAEPAFDCAGSAKSEGMGIALLEAVASDDPTALVGLPLITLCRFLTEAGMPPLAGARP